MGQNEEEMQRQKEEEGRVEVKVINRYIYNGEEYEKVRDLNNGQILARNIQTGQTIRLSQTDLMAVA